jgi:hypothetical protein
MDKRRDNNNFRTEEGGNRFYGQKEEASILGPGIVEAGIDIGIGDGYCPVRSCPDSECFGEKSP